MTVTDFSKQAVRFGMMVDGVQYTFWHVHTHSQAIYGPHLVCLKQIKHAFLSLNHPLLYPAWSNATMLCLVCAFYLYALELCFVCLHVFFTVTLAYRNKSAKPFTSMAFTFYSKLLTWVNQIHTASPLRSELSQLHSHLVLCTLHYFLMSPPDGSLSYNKRLVHSKNHLHLHFLLFLENLYSGSILPCDKVKQKTGLESKYE